MAHTEVLQSGMNWGSPDSIPNRTEVKISPAPQQSTMGTMRETLDPAQPPLTAPSVSGTRSNSNFLFYI